MNNHRFILESYSGMQSRHSCPSCNKKKTFSLYIDNETKQPVAPVVGRCNRESNCGYHYTPRQYFKDYNLPFDSMGTKAVKLVKSRANEASKAISTISSGLLKGSLKSHDSNNFVNYLCKLFGRAHASELIGRYFIGSSKHWNGATVFWQIDVNGRIRTGKIMLYDPCTGKRVKEPYDHITWAHKLIGGPDYNLQQCLFGEHLLTKEPMKPVAIVESEKTAIIASAYLPQFIWLACGSLVNLNQSNCAVLKGRNITLYPDLNGFSKWQKKAVELSSITKFSISELLEAKATAQERAQGLDLADYLVHHHFSSFIIKQKSDIVSYSIEDVVKWPSLNRLGEDFGNITIIGLEMKTGEKVDILFKPDEEPIGLHEMEDEVKYLASFFGKLLTPIIFNNSLCWRVSHR